MKKPSKRPRTGCAVSFFLVDDNEQWRTHVRRILQVRPEWTIVAEACDGGEAIEKAEKLQPDIILLDIGLPTLNGIEAATSIQQQCAISQIIFLTQNSDKEVIEAALSIPRTHYVWKGNAATGLAQTIATVVAAARYRPALIGSSDPS